MMVTIDILSKSNPGSSESWDCQCKHSCSNQITFASNQDERLRARWEHFFLRMIVNTRQGLLRSITNRPDVSPISQDLRKRVASGPKAKTGISTRFPDPQAASRMRRCSRRAHSCNRRKRSIFAVLRGCLAPAPFTRSVVRSRETYQFVCRSIANHLLP